MAIAGTGSYARGDQPRSVPDVDGPAYEAAMRMQRANNARQEEEWWRKHPGVAESIVPVWGSAREAVADAAEGDYLGAALNGALAVADLAPGAFAAKAATKVGVKGLIKGGSNTWNATRKWMGKNGLAETGQHVHHGIIPQGGWGKKVPDRVKNQLWNATPMPSPQVHGRIHGPYGGLPRYPLPQRYWIGAPNWAKSAHVWLPSGGITLADSAQERSHR